MIRNKDYTLSCRCTNELTEVGPAGLAMSTMFEAGLKRLGGRAMGTNRIATRNVQRAKPYVTRASRS